MAEQVKTVQITVWLGESQTLEIRAYKADDAEPCRDKYDFIRTAVGATGGIKELLQEITDKLAAAFGKDDSVPICVRDKKIIRCATPPAGSSAE